MRAEFILGAIRNKYPTTAIVPEISIDDFDIPDSEGDTEGRWWEHTNSPEGHKYLRRIDALMFDSLIRTAIEIKVSKADFNRDTYWKRRMWQRHCHRFIYAVPEDLDIIAPHGCGLWRIDESGFLMIDKKAIVNKSPEPLPQTVVQRIAYRASI